MSAAFLEQVEQIRISVRRVEGLHAPNGPVRLGPAGIQRAPPTALLSRNAETSCIVLHICVLEKKPNLGFGSRVRACVCGQIGAYVWPLQWSFDSRGEGRMFCGVIAPMCFSARAAPHYTTQSRWREKNFITAELIWDFHVVLLFLLISSLHRCMNSL